jgi:L-histidine Nalpha-methyltransferase
VTTTAQPVVVERHLDASDLDGALSDDVRAGLTATPKWLPPKWFYDERGSRLFDEITRLPEYYPTRTERALLARLAGQIATGTSADTLVELGSGTSEKTRLLLTALHEAGTLQRFVPFDVDETTLNAAASAVAADYPGVVVRPVVGDLEHHVPWLPRDGRRLIAFLGSTIGNLEPQARVAFLGQVAESLRPGDAFLLGTDLVKDPVRLVAAYDDAAGVTADFNKNVLAVINDRLDADFDLDAFEHVATWNPDLEWIEMRLRARERLAGPIRALDLTVRFAAGEEVRTEVSAKFRRAGVERELAAAGLRLAEWWTDPAGDFALSLSVPA